MDFSTHVRVDMRDTARRYFVYSDPRDVAEQSGNSELLPHVVQMNFKMVVQGRIQMLHILNPNNRNSS